MLQSWPSFLRWSRFFPKVWMWMALLVLAAIYSYFVRQLLVALLFFTVFYVLLAALVVLYILFVEALDRGTVWLESFGRSFPDFAHHHFASPAWLASRTNDRFPHGHNAEASRSSMGRSANKTE
jgi:hypothetical protein